MHIPQDTKVELISRSTYLVIQSSHSTYGNSGNKDSTLGKLVKTVCLAKIVITIKGMLESFR